MATQFIYDITGSANSKAVIRANATFGGSAANTKIFELFANASPVFNIKGDGSISVSGNGGVSLPSDTATNGITYYDGSKITGASNILYKPNDSGQANRVMVTGSIAINQFIAEGQWAPTRTAEGSIYLGVDLNKRLRNPTQYALIGPEYLAIRTIVDSNITGSAYFTMHPSSSNFINAGRTQRSTTVASQNFFHNILQIQDNSFYFWPTLYSYSTIGRGAGLGIGVIPPTRTVTGSSLKAALHVNVFSASAAAIGAGGWNGTATGVINRQAAIVVTYGSGSAGSPFVQNFYVSSSGAMYMRGWALIDAQASSKRSLNGNYALRVNNAPAYFEYPITSSGIRSLGAGYVQNNLQVIGTLTKGGGSFLIEHPDPVKAAEGYKLRHCFVESPTRGDNLYRYQIITTQNNLSTTVILPDYWQYLNENPQVWISPVDCFGVAYGSVNETLTEINITTNMPGTYNVLLMGTRKDDLMKNYFDSDGVEFIDNENLPS